MMTYEEAKKKIEAVRWGDERVFRLAIHHLIDVGARHLTDENVEQTCKSIMENGDSCWATAEFQCDIVRGAKALSEVDIDCLLVYISEKVDIDVGQHGVYPHGDCSMCKHFSQYDHMKYPCCDCKYNPKKENMFYDSWEEAEEETEIEDCDTCKYGDELQWNYPCSCCKKNVAYCPCSEEVAETLDNLYERKEEDDED